MSQTAQDFITRWVTENVNEEAFENEGDSARAAALAERCRADARSAGIPDQEMDVAIQDMIVGGSLESYMASAMESATDADVQRFADKDG